MKDCVYLQGRRQNGSTWAPRRFEPSLLIWWPSLRGTEVRQNFFTEVRGGKANSGMRLGDYRCVQPESEHAERRRNLQERGSASVIDDCTTLNR